MSTTTENMGLIHSESTLVIPYARRPIRTPAVLPSTAVSVAPATTTSTVTLPTLSSLAVAPTLSSLAVAPTTASAAIPSVLPAPPALTTAIITPTLLVTPPSLAVPPPSTTASIATTATTAVSPAPTPVVQASETSSSSTSSSSSKDDMASVLLSISSKVIVQEKSTKGVERAVLLQRVMEEVGTKSYETLLQEIDAEHLSICNMRWELQTKGLSTSEIKRRHLPLPHQLRVLKELEVAWRKGNKSAVIELFTGTGKTNIFIFLFQAIAKSFKTSPPEETRKMIFIVPTIDLLQQTKQRFETYTKKEKFIIKLLQSPNGKKLDKEGIEKIFSTSDIVLTTIQTFSKEYIFSNIPFKEYNPIVVIDEAHTALSELRKSCVNTILNKTQCRLLAATATAFLEIGGHRTVYELLGFNKDGSNNPITPYGLQEAIQDGVIAPVVTSLVYPEEYRKFHFKKNAKSKEINLTHAAEILNKPKYNKMVVSLYLNTSDPVSQEPIRGKKAIVYCGTIEHAKTLATEFNAIPIDRVDPSKKLRTLYEQRTWEHFLNEERNAFLENRLNTGKILDETRLRKKWEKVKDSRYGSFSIAQDYHSQQKKEETKKILLRSQLGGILVLTNALKLVEGYDDPEISVIIRLVPTLSSRVVLQTLGRGERTTETNPNKYLTIFELCVGNEQYKYVNHFLKDKTTLLPRFTLGPVDRCRKAYDPKNNLKPEDIISVEGAHPIKNIVWQPQGIPTNSIGAVIKLISEGLLNLEVAINQLKGLGILPAESPKAGGGPGSATASFTLAPVESSTPEGSAKPDAPLITNKRKRSGETTSPTAEQSPRAEEALDDQTGFVLVISKNSTGHKISARPKKKTKTLSPPSKKQDVQENNVADGSKDKPIDITKDRTSSSSSPADSGSRSSSDSSSSSSSDLKRTSESSPLLFSKSVSTKSKELETKDKQDKPDQDRKIERDTDPQASEVKRDSEDGKIEKERAKTTGTHKPSVSKTMDKTHTRLQITQDLLHSATARKPASLTTSSSTPKSGESTSSSSLENEKISTEVKILLDKYFKIHEEMIKLRLSPKFSESELKEKHEKLDALLKEISNIQAALVSIQSSLKPTPLSTKTPAEKTSSSSPPRHAKPPKNEAEIKAWLEKYPHITLFDLVNKFKQNPSMRGAFNIAGFSMEAIANQILKNNPIALTLQDKNKNTPFHLLDDSNLCRFFVKNKANANILNDEADTPLHKFLKTYFSKIAIPESELQFIPWLDSNYLFQLLTMPGLDINLADKNGDTALHLYMRGQGSKVHYEELLLFMALGAKFDIKNALNQTPLDLLKATTVNHYCERLFPSVDADVSSSSSSATLPSTLSTKGHSVTINRQDKAGKTFLHYAVSHKILSTISELLALGANPHIKDSYHETPIFGAVRNTPPRPVTVNSLLKHKADVNLFNDKQESPLSIALSGTTYKNGIRVIKAVLKVTNKDTLNRPDPSGNTPLHLLMRQAFSWSAVSPEQGLMYGKKVVQFFLEQEIHASVPLSNGDGDTPFHIFYEKFLYFFVNDIYYYRGRRGKTNIISSNTCHQYLTDIEAVLTKRSIVLPLTTNREGKTIASLQEKVRQQLKVIKDNEPRHWPIPSASPIVCLRIPMQLPMLPPPIETSLVPPSLPVPVSMSRPAPTPVPSAPAPSLAPTSVPGRPLFPACWTPSFTNTRSSLSSVPLSIPAIAQTSSLRTSASSMPVTTMTASAATTSSTAVVSLLSSSVSSGTGTAIASPSPTATTSRMTTALPISSLASSASIFPPVLSFSTVALPALRNDFYDLEPRPFDDNEIRNEEMEPEPTFF